MRERVEDWVFRVSTRGFASHISNRISKSETRDRWQSAATLAHRPEPHALLNLSYTKQCGALQIFATTILLFVWQSYGPYCISDVTDETDSRRGRVLAGGPIGGLAARRFALLYIIFLLKIKSPGRKRETILCLVLMVARSKLRHFFVAKRRPVPHCYV
jgi:hypothetical protein